MRKKIGPLAWAVLLFAVILIALTAIRLTGVGSGFPNPLGGVLRGALVPVEQFVWNLGDGVRDNAKAIFQFRKIREENEVLRRQVEQLTKDNLELKQNVLAGLRYEELEQYVFSNPVLDKYEKIGATIVMRNPTAWYKYVTVNRGQRDGVAVNDSVVGNLGLVGKVVSVTETTADILLLTDGDGQVAALTRNSEGQALFGVVKGNYKQGSRLEVKGSLEMEFRQEDDVNVGEVVYTSGLGGIYPKEVPVGVVSGIKVSSSGMLKVAYIEPLIEFAYLEEVYIIKMTGTN